jgi:excisionase family DNA binding protein
VLALFVAVFVVFIVRPFHSTFPMAGSPSATVTYQPAISLRIKHSGLKPGDFRCYRRAEDFIKLRGLFGRAARGNRPMAKLSNYVKTAKAAEILGVSQNTLRTWASAGKIPVHQNPANGYRLFRKTDLENFLRQIELSRTKQAKRKNR